MLGLTPKGEGRGGMGKMFKKKKEDGGLGFAGGRGGGREGWDGIGVFFAGFWGDVWLRTGKRKLYVEWVYLCTYLTFKSYIPIPEPDIPFPYHTGGGGPYSLFLNFRPL